VLRRERLTPNALVRLRREAATARDVVHPNLIRVFDLGTADDLTFLAMEAVDGESLRGRLRRGPLAVEESIRIASELLRGLSALHGAGLLHRDVKPGNVLIASDGTVKLADLGLVRRWESQETRATESEAVIGTFEYLSPEQALGEELDVRSDLYSLGAVLFEMLAGRLPHEGKSSLGTLLANLNEPVPELRSLRPDVPRWLSRVVHRLLERQRDDRYRSAEEVLGDLERKRAPGPRFSTRTRVPIAALAVLGALAGALVLVWLARPRFAAMVVDGRDSVRAIDTNGKVLWSRSGIRPNDNFVPIRIDHEGRRVIAAAFGSFDGLPPGVERETVRLLDPLTGGEVGRLALLSSAARFGGFADVYTREIRAFDIDGDGLDEIVVTYLHVPFWPSFSLLCEPSLGRCRPIFLGSGHHRPLGVADVDGDGSAELILGGINNRMGWFNGIAALRILPPVGDVQQLVSGGVASSPDEIRSDFNGSFLAWYALTPPGSISVLPDFRPRIDRDSREIRLPTYKGEVLRLGYDGFLVKDRSEKPAVERRSARLEAYAALREVARLNASAQIEPALEWARRAVDQARAATDSTLEDWALRTLGRTLIAAERFEQGEEILETAMTQSVDPAGVTWEAARSYHLRGRPEDAMRWYARGLAMNREAFVARPTREFVEGELFALAELQRWPAARAAVETWARTYETVRAYAPVLLAWIRWRTGELAPGERSDPGESDVDFQVYVSLELRATGGEDPQYLLAEVQSLEERSSETRPLLRSLEAELLARLGRSGEASVASRDALESARNEGAVNVYVRAHLPVIEERARRLSG